MTVVTASPAICGSPGTGGNVQKRRRVSPGVERCMRHEVAGEPTSLEDERLNLLAPAHFGLWSCHGTMIW